MVGDMMKIVIKRLGQLTLRKAILIPVVVAIVAAAGLMGRAGRTTNPHVVASSKPTLEDYRKLPVYFEQNRGQTDPRVRYVSRGPGYTVFLTGAGAVLALKRAVEVPAALARAKVKAGERPAVKFQVASVWLNLVGARADARIEGIDRLEGRVSYFIGNDPKRWHSDIPTYARVRYESVYRGIDLIYHGSTDALEYDLVAAPGADTNAIEIELKGGEKTRIDQAGDLIIGTAAGDLTMRRPRVYQDDASGNRHLVEARYRVSDGASGKGKTTVQVAVADHDPRLALVIDPEIVYSTYLGGKGDRSGAIQGFQVLPPLLLGSLSFSDLAVDLALGPNNTAFVTGLAYSSNFPTTPGVLQAVDQSTSTTPNAFVAKFDTTKSGAASLVYSTYLGGAGCNSPLCSPGADGDQANGIDVDTTGDAYVAGLTYSKNFPNICPTFGTGNNQGAANINNGFVSELNSTGTKLIYSCFIHGSDGAPASGIAVQPGCASNCTAYVVGNTTSQVGAPGGPPDFPIVNGFQTTNPDKNGNSAGYVMVVKEPAAGTPSLLYSTYLGGTGTPQGGESLTRIVVAPSPNCGVSSTAPACPAFVTGGTFSANDYPKSAIPFQTVNKAGPIAATNAVVSELNPAASGAASLLYSTYLGGSGTSVFFLGSFGDVGVGITLDAANHVYVTGATASQDFPLSVAKPPYQTFNKSTFNVFVTELDPTQAKPGNQLIYSTYLGGNGFGAGLPIGVGDAGTDLAVDAKGLISVTGATTSTDFPVTGTCTALSSLNGQADAFVTILDPNAAALSQLVFSTYLGGSGIDGGAALARDLTGKLYVGGLTLSPDFPVTFSAYQFGNGAFTKGSSNAFVTELDPSSNVCPTPFPSPKTTPTSTATKAVATATPTAKPTPTPTKKPTATPTKKPTANPDQEADANADEVRADGNANQEADSNADQEADGNANQEADGNADQEADGNANQEADGDADQEADGNANQEADGDADQEADGDADQEADGDANQEADGDADQEADGDADQEADGHSNEVDLVGGASQASPTQS